MTAALAAWAAQPFLRTLRFSKPGADGFDDEGDVGNAWVGFASAKFADGKGGDTYPNTAAVDLARGWRTYIRSEVSLDMRWSRPHRGLQLLPETKPYDLALRCTKHGHVPQIRFNAPKGRTALIAGPWLLYRTVTGTVEVGLAKIQMRTDLTSAEQLTG